MEWRRVGKLVNLARFSVIALGGSFFLLTLSPVKVSASCLLGLVCAPSPTPTPASATPTPKPSGVGGVVGGVVSGATGTVNNTVNNAVNTVNGLLGQTGAPTLPPTPCVTGCASATPTPSGSDPTSGDNTTSGGASPGSGGNNAGGNGSQGAGANGKATGATTLHGQLAAQQMDLTTPPSVLGLGPIAGIDFGNAPFLWPLFLALDVAAFGAVVYVIRRKGFVVTE